MTKVTDELSSIKDTVKALCDQLYLVNTNLAAVAKGLADTQKVLLSIADELKKQNTGKGAAK